ncbi:hypothetical protein TcCL_Unassigned01962 [Trypanosoma cruzi]|nr:hypothetical protein TcCL_Unassigned01962 [Trypanosoma cruzi]
MKGCRQEALTINMAREHAATPRRNTGEKGEKEKKQEVAQSTQNKQIIIGKSTATALVLASDSTPALTHTHTHTQSQCCQSAGEKIRPLKTNAHTASSHLPWTRRNNTQPPPPAQSHGQRDTATAPQPAHNARGASNHPKSHTRKRILTHP